MYNTEDLHWVDSIIGISKCLSIKRIARFNEKYRVSRFLRKYVNNRLRMIQRHE